MESILVVDDDGATRRLLQGILTREGYAVTIASDAREARVRFAERKFDLVLVDVRMPGMTGIELLATLHAEGANPRAVVLTADDTSETLLEAVRERAHRFLKKPVEPKSLVAVVRAALAARPELPAIEVLSAKSNWVELLVPCALEAADRVQSFLGQLDADLPPEVRDSVGTAFHELLRNAVEWGGELDPSRRVRIAYLRARRMILYRIDDPGKGFRFEELAHSAAGRSPDDAVGHVRVREEKGLRPGGFGLLMTSALVDELIYNEAHNEVVFIKYLD